MAESSREITSQTLDKGSGSSSRQKHATTAAGAAAAAATQHHAANHPHHLKWGEINVSGFAPEDEDDDEHLDPDKFAHPGCAKHTPEERLRKMTRDRSLEAVDAESRRIHAKRRYLFRKPRALQYFRGKTLVRSEEERSSSRLELFFDLAFVGIIAVLAEEAVHDPTGASLVRYLITYTAAYLIWSWMREIFNAFYKDDLGQRLLVLFVMACLVVYGNNAPGVQQNLSEGPARASAIGSYLVAECAIFSCFFIYSFYVKQYRAQLRVHSAAWLGTSAIWIGCIFVDVKAAVAMAVVALVLEYGAWLFAYTNLIKRLLRLRYSSALNIEHEIERFNDFFTLVMGEFIFSTFARQPAGIGVHVSAARAVLSVVIAFCFQLFYMQGGSSKQISHPIRYKYWTGIAFFSLHIPIVSALTLCGDSMALLIAEEHVSSALRWYTCETYAIGMIGIWCLAMIEHERDVKGELWLPKWARLMPRLLAGVVAIFLPFTPQKETAEHAASTSVEAATSHLAISALRRATEAAAAAVTGEAATTAAESTASTDTGGVDITTTKLLAILACMSFFAFIWEQVTSLDGPNAEHECAADEYLSRADDTHTPKSALSTPKWRGFPTLAEPGLGTFDRTHQRDHRRMQKSPSQLSEQTTLEENI